MISKSQTLIFELLYPAILGAGIVGLALRIALHHSLTEGIWDEAIPLGALLLIFFISSFLATSAQYKLGAFFLDLVEVVLMFLAFYWLRLFEPRLDQPWAAGVYLVLAILILLQLAWRAINGVSPWHAWWHMRVLAAAILVIGIFLHSCFEWTSLVVSIVLAALIITYDCFRTN